MRTVVVGGGGGGCGCVVVVRTFQFWHGSPSALGSGRVDQIYRSWSRGVELRVSRCRMWREKFSHTHRGRGGAAEEIEKEREKFGDDVLLLGY